nr:craniofacial development protein 2-like [Tanacetum cinerariifolium]
MAISIVIDGENVNVISAYTPHVRLSDVVKKSFLDALDELVRDCPPDQLLILGGDLNGGVHKGFGYGTRNDAGVHKGFGYGFGTRNEEGRTVLNFTAAHDLVVANTFFKKRDVHLVTFQNVLFERQRKRMAETGRQRIIWKNFKRDAVETFRVTISEKLSTFGEDMEVQTKIATNQARFRELLLCCEGNQDDKAMARLKGSGDGENFSQTLQFDCYYSRINQREVRVALQKMRRNKSLGPDQIPIEAKRKYCVGFRIRGWFKTETRELEEGAKRQWLKGKEREDRIPKM